MSVAQYYDGLIQPASASASSAAAGYPASAVLLPGVLRGWQSAAAGNQYLQVDLGANYVVGAVALQAVSLKTLGDLTVNGDTNNPPSNVLGNVARAPDENNRNKGSLAFPLTNMRYIRFSANVTGGVFAIGSVFVFAKVNPLACDPLYGGSSINEIFPQVRAELPNGIVEAYSAGVSVTEIELGFRAGATDDIESIQRSARAAPVWFDFGLPDRGRQWPVRHVEPSTQRRLDGYNRESITLKLREIT